MHDYEDSVKSVPSHLSSTAEEPHPSAALLSLAADSKAVDRAVRAEPGQLPMAPTAPVPALFRAPGDSVLETAAKLLFLAVRWAHTIPSFLQVRLSSYL